jgi:AcrR family transcriptional regulator
MTPTIWGGTLASHKQRLREHIVRTAADLIGERGNTAVPMSVLARRAGIARATLYNHFPDFERVLAALVAHEVTQFRLRLDRQLADAPNPTERLRRYVYATYHWATQTRRPRRADPNPARKRPPQVIATMHEPLTELREILTTILTDGITTGDFPTDIDPAVYADIILKLVLEPLPATAHSRTTVRNQLLQFIHRGLTAPPG